MPFFFKWNSPKRSCDWRLLLWRWGCSLNCAQWTSWTFPGSPCSWLVGLAYTSQCFKCWQHTLKFLHRRFSIVVSFLEEAVYLFVTFSGVFWSWRGQFFVLHLKSLVLLKQCFWGSLFRWCLLLCSPTPCSLLCLRARLTALFDSLHDAHLARLLVIKGPRTNSATRYGENHFQLSQAQCLAKA